MKRFGPSTDTAADRAAHEAKYAGTQSEGRARFNETWPAYEAVAGSDDGRLWVKVREARDDDHTALWVIDPESMTSKRGVIDGNVTPMSISDGRLYGIRVDVDGLETLVRYRIVE